MRIKLFIAMGSFFLLITACNVDGTNVEITSAAEDTVDPATTDPLMRIGTASFSDDSLNSIMDSVVR